MKRKIKVCPICLSSKIRRSSSFDDWLIPAVYICENCGYRGPVYLEVEVDTDEEKYENSSKDTG